MRAFIFLLPVLFFIEPINCQSQNDSTLFQIGNITIAGNRVTKEKVILRELLFCSGDYVKKSDIDSLFNATEESLLNTSLFNFVTIKSIVALDNSIEIFIILEERWYVWPIPILEHADRNLSSFLYEQDWDKINYGMLLEIHNLRGMNEFLKLKFRKGYKEQIQVAYEIPYLTKNKRHGLETEFSYFKKNETEYNTINDKLVFYRNDNSYALKYYRGSISYKYRYKHYTHHRFSIGYYHGFIHDSIILLNPNYFDKALNTQKYFNVEYSLNINKTNIHYYPLEGYHFYTGIQQAGLGLLENEMNSITSATAFAYFYNKLSYKWYAGWGVKGKLSSNFKQPYFYENALGYETYLRAYEYNVIGGQQYITTRSFIKYNLVPEKIIHFSQIKLNRFNKIHYAIYSNIFFETGYVHDKNPNTDNKLPNNFLASTGIGLDLVTYYDIVFRMEYSVNVLGENGFFVHLKKAF